ncbi:hypothetical protein [Fontivita pretiosa]|uniref:hypothetical protein n=1 Tax=Fontivita pretiosa TaxID=2989684 RepID=UPI003D17E1CD
MNYPNNQESQPSTGQSAHGDTTTTRRTVGLVGHCAPDAAYLRLAVMKAVKNAPDVQVVAVDDQAELEKLLAQGVDLLLINRQLEYGFESDQGVELIRRLRTRYPGLKMMLVSNYRDAQEEASLAGALPGFGKREIGSPRVTQLLRAALGCD